MKQQKNAPEPCDHLGCSPINSIVPALSGFGSSVATLAPLSGVERVEPKAYSKNGLFLRDIDLVLLIACGHFGRVKYAVTGLKCSHFAEFTGNRGTHIL